jgi:hypothetical protein
MFEKIVAFVLCAFVVALGGSIVYLTHKGWDKRVAGIREGKNAGPVPVKAKNRVKPKTAKKRRR